MSRRSGVPIERLTEPSRLVLWLAANDLDPGREATPTDLDRALHLREAIYRAGAAVARSLTPTEEDVRTINEAAAAGRPVPAWESGQDRWRLTGPDHLTDALAVIAHDAIRALGGAPARVKTCEGPDCAGLFLDTSRGGSRRWCSMNTCGNKAKKSRMR
nr:ABATE domain-containing protein [Microbacterium sp. B19]